MTTAAQIITGDSTLYKNWIPSSSIATIYDAAKKIFCKEEGKTNTHTDSTGSALINGKAQIWQCETIGELAAVTRTKLSEEIADRLLELDRVELEEGDEPLKVRSVQWFLKYCFERGVEGRPAMGRTPDGVLQADFFSESYELNASIRFLPNDRVLVYFVINNVDRAFDAPVIDLIEKQFAHIMPDWL